jgi:hypothetical protein
MSQQTESQREDRVEQVAQNRGQERDQANALARGEERALNAVQKALDTAAEAWRECREGAIEGRGGTIAEMVCAKLTDAIGAEDARRLGEGAAKVVSGDREQGIRECAEAGVRLAVNIAEQAKAVENGKLAERIMRTVIENEVKDWVRKADQENKQNGGRR